MEHASKPIVHRSIESAYGTRCVDICQHPDGRWSFTECRRDPEDAHGWRPLNAAEPARHATRSDAMAAAHARVGWLTST